MAVTLDSGGGSSVTIEEPQRDQFADKLAGAFEFSIARLMYKVLELTGNAMGSFLSGIAVSFLDRIEPSLVEYAKPLIDMLLSMDELPDAIREFLTPLKEPTNAGAATLLTSLGGQASGAIFGNLLGVLLSPATTAANALIRPRIPDVTDLFTMYFRGGIGEDDLYLNLAKLGYSDEFIDAYQKLSPLRPGIQDLMEGLIRGNLEPISLSIELQKRGIQQADIQLLIANAVNIPDERNIVTALRLRSIDDTEARRLLTQKGYNDAGQSLLFGNERQLLSTDEALRAMYFGQMSQQDVRYTLLQNGFIEPDITRIMQSSSPVPGPGDLIRFGLREAYDDDVAITWGYDEDYPEQLTADMALHGFDANWSKLFWRAHWQLPSITQGFEMMHRDIIKPDDLSELLRLQDIPPVWRQHLLDMSYRTLTRVDIRRMHDMGILNDAQVKKSYLDYGYSPDNAEYMLQFTKAYNGQDPTTTTGRTLELSRTIVISSYQKGIISRPEAETRLQAVGYDSDDITLLLALADWQGEIDRTPTYYNEHHRDVKAIVERAYSRRLIGTQEAHDALVQIGYSDSESELLLITVDWWYSFERMEAEQKRIGDAYSNRSIDRNEAISRLGQMNIPSEMQDQLLGEWESERNVRYRKLTEAQYRRAATSDIITQTQYMEELRGLGYTEGDINIAVALYLQ